MIEIILGCVVFVITLPFVWGLFRGELAECDKCGSKGIHMHVDDNDNVIMFCDSCSTQLMSGVSK